MNTEELVRQMVALRPAVLAAVALTLAAYFGLWLCVRRLRIKGPGAKIAGLFVGLDGRSALHLSFAWAKFALLAACLLLARPVQPVHYLLLAALTLGTLLLWLRPAALVTEAVGGGLLLAGLAVCSTLLNYLRQIRNETAIRAAYWLLAVFLILCAAALLLREIPAVSKERTWFDEKGELE